MGRISIARSVQLALLGLTLVLTAIAGVGVASLYSARQDYEDRLAEALELQASAARLLAASVVDEATLRTQASPATRRAARAAYDTAAADARAKAANDRESLALIGRAAAAQSALRTGGRPAAAREPLSRLASRQEVRATDARDDARDESRQALIAVVVGGGLALAAALGLVAMLLRALRRPLDALVRASGSLAAGNLDARVHEDGPDELRELGRSFNAMAGDLAQARARIEAERAKLDVTVRSLGDGLVLASPSGEVTAVNPRAHELMPRLDKLPELQEALSAEVLIESEGRTIAVTAARMQGDAGVVWTLRDISERARLERLKSEFVATASHELRSPLTSIKGFIELLSASPGLDERQREFVEIVHLSANRLVDLVNDLLDVARIEAGRVEVHRRPTDLGELVGEVTTLMRPRIEAKQQRLDVTVAPDLPRALADPGRIRQVVTNLLTNAHLYTPEGGRIAVFVEEHPGGLRVAVEDTGRGMTPDELDHVFDRFFRGADGSGAPGTGLGLAIVKSLVDLHQGAIDVESEPGKGTTFAVTLPVAVDEDHLPAARHALGGKRVLVLDDEPAIARLIAERLEPYGVVATVAHDGEEALRELRARHYDAVTVDILMPGMSGFEVLRALRADPKLSRVPAVVVSVFSGREALSGEWVVSKPIDADELADSLGAAVLAGRVRVLVVGRERVREPLGETLDQLGIEHVWATTARDAQRMCRDRYFEVALVDAGLPDSRQAIACLDLRGRRLRRSVVVFSAEEETRAGFARLDADPVPLGDAGATVLGLLAAEPRGTAG